MSRRALPLALLLGAAIVVPLLLLRGGDSPAQGGAVGATLGWEGTPQVVAVDGLPRDRILTGRLTNESPRPADLSVDDVTVLGADGEEVRSSVRFLGNFAHGLFSADAIHFRGQPGDSERRRLGEIATLKPGQAIPITLSWRVAEGGAPPARVDFGGSTVELP